MKNQNRYPIKIRLGIGVLKKNINRSVPVAGVCKNCGKKIYWIKVMGDKWKLQADHVKDNEFSHHALTCPTVLAYEEKQKRSNLKNLKNNKLNKKI